MTIERHHPKALWFLFLTELWERFGFYVVQGMLVLYMAHALGFSDDKSYTIMGVFSALAYIAPFVGGSLADRLLGFKTSIILGGSFLSVGYAMLALPWGNLFYLSLATIIIGNGLFKPNISSLLGSLYEPEDPNRDSGFTLFYIGINLGILLAGISSGYIKDHFGWHAGFALGSIGLLIGLITFGIGIKNLSELKYNPLDSRPQISAWGQLGVVVGSIVTIFVVSLLLQSSFIAKWLLPVVGIVLCGYLLIVTYRQEPGFRKPLLTLYVLILSSVIFWMMLMQMFFSTNLFIDRLVEKNWFGFHIPTTAFYALEGLFVIVMGPAFAWSWQTLSRADKNPSPFSKFVLAIAFAGLGYLVLGASTYFPSASNMINPLWIVVNYLLLVIGEMLLSPIGLSAVTSLAPRKLVGMLMGVWFMALGFGYGFAGWLAKLSNIPDNIKDLATWNLIYRHAFLEYSYIAFGVATGLYVMHLFIKKILPAE